MTPPTANPLFGWLVLSLHEQAWVQLGKVAHPMSGKIERDIEGARQVIDMLGMLEEKTRGNLAPEEESLLRDRLLQLRLNFVEERDKPAASSAGATADEAPEGQAETKEDPRGEENSKPANSRDTDAV